MRSSSSSDDDKSSFSSLSRMFDLITGSVSAVDAADGGRSISSWQNPTNSCSDRDTYIIDITIKCSDVDARIPVIFIITST
jgi:hypothetical protein